MTLHDLAELAPPADYELISDLLENFERERVNSDEPAFLRFCLSAFQRLSGKGRNIFPLIPLLAVAVASVAALVPGRWAARTNVVEVLHAE